MILYAMVVISVAIGICLRKLNRQLREMPPKSSNFQFSNSLECSICGEELQAKIFYTIQCSSSHMFCLNCLQNYSQHKYRDGEKITCPGSGCGKYELEISELKSIGLRSEFIVSYCDRLTEKLLEDIAVACPTRDCKNYCIPSCDGEAERFFCISCKFASCTLCKEEFHFGTQCSGVPLLKSKWNIWSEIEREKFWRNPPAESLSSLRKTCPVMDALSRFTNSLMGTSNMNSFQCFHCKKDIKFFRFASIQCQSVNICEECDRREITNKMKHTFRIITELPMQSLENSLIELDLNKELINLTTKACPKCKKPIEKNGGCAHMTCKCGHDFFWCCLREYRDPEQSRAHNQQCQ